MPASLLHVLAALTLLAQSPAPAAAPAPTRPSITVGIEPRDDHFNFRFDHPSNFDTVDLVPHFFEQRYGRGVSTWVLVSAAYSFLGARGSTEAGFTPSRTTAGSDIDTFIDPSGDVITSGTDGLVRQRSFSIDQRFGLVTRGAWTIGVALGYRQSHAEFFPDDIIVTHTQPPSVTRTFTKTRETTVSRVIESGVSAHARWHIGGGWQGDLSGAMLPLTRARLVISLPDKFPEDIVNDALAFTARGRLALERPWPHFAVGVAFDASAARGYRRTSAYEERSVGAGVFVRVGR